VNLCRSYVIALYFVRSSFLVEWVIIVAATCLLAIRQTQLRRHDSYLGFYMELRKSFLDVKRKADNVYNIDANKDGGWCCSSGETFVMRVERSYKVVCCEVGRPSQSYPLFKEHFE
jgi:hypothetical protein